MRDKVQSWGNSLGLRIPKAYAQELQVGPGSTLELSMEAGVLLAKPSAAVELDALLARVNPDNNHHELDWSQVSLGLPGPRIDTVLLDWLVQCGAAHPCQISSRSISSPGKRGAASRLVAASMRWGSPPPLAGHTSTACCSGISSQPSWAPLA